jgi:hypothetical protein
MTNTEAGLRQRESAADVRRDQSHRVFAWTETRRAFMTTEFWIAIAMAAAVIVAAYKNDGVNLGIDQAWALGSGIIAFYVLSRGIAKAGNSDPSVRDFDRG